MAFYPDRIVFGVYTVRTVSVDSTCFLASPNLFPPHVPSGASPPIQTAVWSQLLLLLSVNRRVNKRIGRCTAGQILQLRRSLEILEDVTCLLRFTAVAAAANTDAFPLSYFSPQSWCWCCYSYHCCFCWRAMIYDYWDSTYCPLPHYRVAVATAFHDVLFEVSWQCVIVIRVVVFVSVFDVPRVTTVLPIRPLLPLLLLSVIIVLITIICVAITVVWSFAGLDVSLW